jgi:hypothetical protein
MVKGGVAIFYCGLEKIAEPYLLEVPRWMFNATVCYRTYLAAAPTLSVEAWVELKRQTLDSHNVAVEARHTSIQSTGGADANPRLVKIPSRDECRPLRALNTFARNSSSLGSR